MSNSKPTSNKYVLIDFENVQPKNLEILRNHPFTVLVFIGANQTRLSRQLVLPMQELGKNARYVAIEGSGPNALDFHIAYYIGEIAGADPDAQFHVISKDRGFDPLIKHLETKKIQVQREKDIAEIPELRISVTTSSDKKIDAVIRNLKGRGHSRPRKVKTLRNAINSLFTEKLDDRELDSIVAELRKRKLIVEKQGNVSYKL